ncbi:Uncharacterised protein [Mycobacteroides abscessus]|nr:Uncharacterised protein [Mycobacteroides abscessus]
MTNTATREQNSHRLDWGIKAPPGRVHAPVAESEALIEPFLRRCKEQEDMYVAAGFPLDGISEFWRKWFAAWNDDSPEALEDCWAEDLVWTMSNTGQLEFHGRSYTGDFARFGYLFARELGFYPWDGTDTHLPYYDFFNGQVRAAFPYSGSTRFFGIVQSRGLASRFAAAVSTGTSFARRTANGGSHESIPIRTSWPPSCKCCRSPPEPPSS